MSCGPAAATNSLLYLQNAFPNLFGTSLIRLAGGDMDGNGAYTGYDDLIYTAGSYLASSTYMNTTLTNGTWHDNLIWGNYRYLETNSAGGATFSAIDYWCPTYWGNAPATNPPPAWVSGGLPTWNYLYTGLSQSAAVEVLLSYVGGGGHFVSVTGMTWDDILKSGTLSYMNPWTGASDSTTMRLSGGTLYTDYGGTNHAWIGEVSVINAVPEPSPVFLSIGGMLLLWIQSRQRRQA